MRKPLNERPKLGLKHPPAASIAPAAAGETAPERPAKPEKADKEAERRCILTGERCGRTGLIRLVVSPEGGVLPDIRAKAPGRGAWIGVDRAALQTAIGNGKLKSGLSRAFRRRDLTIPPDLADQIEQGLERAALDRLGLEARASTILTGSDRIETAARQGKVITLYHAADAGEDGNRKLDQAWRMGRDEEGSALRGLVISAPRTILSLALGRENVVHIAVIDQGAARRLSETLSRWHRFIGFDLGEQPCGTSSQGSIAAAASGDAAASAAANEGLSTVHE